MTATLKQILQHLRPGAQPIADFVITDRGNGPELDRWTHASAQPTPEEIAAVDAEALAAVLAKPPVDVAKALAGALVAKGVLATSDLPADARAILEAPPVDAPIEAAPVEAQP